MTVSNRKKAPPKQPRGRKIIASDEDGYDDGYDDECSYCGGEGVIYSCDEPYACLDPDGGCGLCERECDWCSPSPKRGRK